MTAFSYVQTDVGIRKQHCQNIVRHLAELQRDDDTAAAALANPNRRITLCVEGNISAGKSSFLQRILKGSVELRDIVEVHTRMSLFKLRLYHAQVWWVQALCRSGFVGSCPCQASQASKLSKALAFQ